MRLALRKAVFIFGLSLMLTLLSDLLDNRYAEAVYKWSDALETVGIGTGIGAVIGFSTQAFYEEPFLHMGNTLIGAGAGMLVGLGVAAYLAASDDEPEISPEEYLPAVEKKSLDPKQLNNKKKSSMRKTPGSMQTMLCLGNLPTGNLSSLAYSPRGWTIAAKVIELRF